MSNRRRTYRLLCADIGGTNSRWAFFTLTTADDNKTGSATSPNWHQGLELVAEQWLDTAPEESINDQLRKLYADGFPLPPEQTDLAVLAVAGPVQRQGRYSKLPLAGLTVDLDLVEREFPIRHALLINDFTAQALAVLAPPGIEAQKILPGASDCPGTGHPATTPGGSSRAAGSGNTDATNPETTEFTRTRYPTGPLAVIGAGTGLGKALLLPGGADTFAPAPALAPATPQALAPAKPSAPTSATPPAPASAIGQAQPLVIPSEGGHADFPFAGGRERDYLEFLLKQRGEERITGNTVVSGRGLSYLHHFLTGQKLEPAAVTAAFTPESETLAWAARFYARVCRNYVLETLATGGLFIAGGVAAKTPQLLTHPAFAQEFHRSPTMDDLLQTIPVHLINAENSGLWGAAIKARLLLTPA